MRVVEDEFLLAMELGEILERLGNGVVGPVGRLGEALALASTEQLDGAFLDVNLGTATFAGIAEKLEARGIPFVFITGYEQKRLPGSLDAAPRLTKPLDERRLEAALDNLRPASSR
jgi:two-component SAPR family response regulator